MPTISTPIHNIVLEFLARAIRQEEGIKGINFPLYLDLCSNERVYMENRKLKKDKLNILTYTYTIL
jgi:hypothetical protein